MADIGPEIEIETVEPEKVTVPVEVPAPADPVEVPPDLVPA